MHENKFTKGLPSIIFLNLIVKKTEQYKIGIQLHSFIRGTSWKYDLYIENDFIFQLLHSTSDEKSDFTQANLTERAQKFTFPVYK